MFKYNLNLTLNEIMPFYNKLYQAKIDDYMPFYNQFIKETMDRDYTSDNTASGSSSSTSENSAEGTNINSNTPNVGLDNVKSGKYASDVSVNNTSSNIKDNSNTTSNSNSTNNEDYEKLIIGYHGDRTLAEILKDMKTDFLDIDLMIINALNPLFMGLYE